MFCYCFAGALYNNFILNWIFFSAENALTLAEWLLVTMPLALSPISMGLSMLSLNILGQPLSVKCDFWVCLACLWNGLKNTLNATIPLYKFPSLPTLDWYWSSTPEVYYGSEHLLTIS